MWILLGEVVAERHPVRVIEKSSAQLHRSNGCVARQPLLGPRDRLRIDQLALVHREDVLVLREAPAVERDRDDHDRSERALCAQQEKDADDQRRDRRQKKARVAPLADRTEE